MEISISVLVRQCIPALPAEVALAPSDDLRAAGLTSIGVVSLMLAVEAAYNVAIPDPDLIPANFRSIEALTALVSRLRRRDTNCRA